MEIRPIRTAADHKAALQEIERLWGAGIDTPEGDKLDVLTTLVEAYESEHFPIRAADPVGVLRFAIEDMGRSQAELAAILGSRSRASEILSGKRRLTTEMIRKISSAWHIPVEVLVPLLGTSGRLDPLRCENLGWPRRARSLPYGTTISR